MSTKKQGPSYQWTKERIKKILHLWNDKTVKEICEELDCKPEQVSYITKILRDNGVNIPKKRRPLIYQNLIREMIAEGSIKQ